MTQQKTKIIAATLIGILVLLIALCVILFVFFGGEEEYRTIQIYRIEGTVTVERKGVGTIEAYDGMMLQSGDLVQTDKDSILYFKMDEDKYALLESESTVRMEASGTGSDSKTVLHLETGSLVSRLDNKLNSDSIYEVNTPNSTMAVRGTIFRIEVTYGENGVSYTNVFVFEGTVACQLLFPEDRTKDNPISAEGGRKLCIRGDDTLSEYVTVDGIVDYRELPLEVLKFLSIAIEEGVELPISKEELHAIIANLEKETAHKHGGGTATCGSPAICASKDCGQPYGETDTTNHTGETEIRDTKAATCCDAGYTGDTYCKTCGAKTASGASLAATGDHPAAACGTDGHHAHDGTLHAPAPCGAAGHCNADGRDHHIAPCQFISHRNCDGKPHNDFCYDESYCKLEIVVTDNGGDWAFTINGTTYEKKDGNRDGEKYYFFFQGNVGDTVSVSRTGTTGDFYAVSGGMDPIFGTTSLEFKLVEGSEEYQITVVIL